MKQLLSYLLALMVGLLALAAIAPTVRALAGALLPLVIVVGVVAVIVRLVFFHTGRF